jgi:hypothetical protein
VPDCNLYGRIESRADPEHFLEPVQKLAKEPWKEYAERAWVDSVGACTRAI